MDIYRAIGLFVAALLVPLILLVIYKAVPSLRVTDPRGWYIAALAIALFLTLTTASPLPEKLLAALASAGVLLFGMVRDVKVYRARKKAS